MSPEKILDAPWNDMPALLLQASMEDVLAAIEIERQGQRREYVLRRLHAVYTKRRRAREWKNLHVGKDRWQV